MPSGPEFRRRIQSAVREFSYPAIKNVRLYTNSVPFQAFFFCVAMEVQRVPVKALKAGDTPQAALRHARFAPAATAPTRLGQMKGKRCADLPKNERVRHKHRDPLAGEEAQTRLGEGDCSLRDTKRLSPRSRKLGWEQRRGDSTSADSFLE